MNHATIWTAFALAIGTAGCAKRPNAAQPSPLQFETKSFERVVPGCGDRSKREEPCVTFRVKWAEVTTAPAPEVKTRINAAIRARLQPKDAPAGFEAEAAAVAEDFAQLHKEFPDSAITFFVRRTAEVIFSNARMLSVEIIEEDFKGGAHPNTHREYLNLAPATGGTVALTDLLVSDGLAKLTALAERRFRSGKEIEEGKSLSAAGYTFPDDKFALSRIWGMTPTGLVIYYNDYEIAPHAAGSPTIELPWSEIRLLIRKEAGITPAQ